MMEKVGVWSFYVGLLIAIIAGFMGELQTTWAWILIVLGLIVGLLNVTAKETSGFLVATIVLMVFGWTGKEMLDTLQFIGPIVGNFVVFVGPAAFIVALKQLYDITKSK